MAREVENLKSEIVTACRSEQPGAILRIGRPFLSCRTRARSTGGESAHGLVSCDLCTSHFAMNHQDNSEPAEKMRVGANLGTFGQGNHNVATPSWEHSRCSLKLCAEDQVRAATRASPCVPILVERFTVCFGFRGTRTTWIILNSRVQVETVQKLRKLISIQGQVLRVHQSTCIFNLLLQKGDGDDLQCHDAGMLQVSLRDDAKAGKHEVMNYLLGRTHCADLAKTWCLSERSPLRQ